MCSPSLHLTMACFHPHSSLDLYLFSFFSFFFQRSLSRQNPGLGPQGLLSACVHRQAQHPAASAWLLPGSWDPRASSLLAGKSQVPSRRGLGFLACPPRPCSPCLQVAHLPGLERVVDVKGGILRAGSVLDHGWVLEGQRPGAQRGTPQEMLKRLLLNCLWLQIVYAMLMFHPPVIHQLP